MKINVNGTGNSSKFIEMLAWIEVLGGVGHSTSFKVFADGDGACRYKFEFETEENNKLYKELKKALVEKHINPNKDIEFFEI
jgi:hypothetical protein